MNKTNHLGRVAVLCLLTAWLAAGCAGAPATRQTPSRAAMPDNATVAVWNLENLSIMPGQGDEMAEFLTAEVVETLKTRGGLQLVEREKLLLALEELNIGSSSLADQQTGLRIGRILGAQLMVFGAYQIIGDSMRIDLRMVEVESGKIIKTAAETAPSSGMKAWLKAAESAASGLY